MVRRFTGERRKNLAALAVTQVLLDARGESVFEDALLERANKHFLELVDKTPQQVARAFK